MTKEADLSKNKSIHSTTSSVYFRASTHSIIACGHTHTHTRVYLARSDENWLMCNCWNILLIITKWENQIDYCCDKIDSDTAGWVLRGRGRLLCTCVTGWCSRGAHAQPWHTETTNDLASCQFILFDKCFMYLCCVITVIIQGLYTSHWMEGWREIPTKILCSFITHCGLQSISTSNNKKTLVFAVQPLSRRMEIHKVNINSMVVIRNLIKKID